MRTRQCSSLQNAAWTLSYGKLYLALQMLKKLCITGYILPWGATTTCDRGYKAWKLLLVILKILSLVLKVCSTPLGLTLCPTHLLILVGVKIRYGEPERWKRIASEIGRTKPSRAPGYKRRHRLNKKDYRPPDTAALLLRDKIHRAKKAAGKQTVKSAASSSPKKLTVFSNLSDDDESNGDNDSNTDGNTDSSAPSHISCVFLHSHW